MTNEVYRVNGPRVISENIDGELILVHMEKGTYYSTDEVGAELWRLIEMGCRVSDMFDALHSQYDAGPEQIANAISTFLTRLRDEDLITIDETPGANAAPKWALSDVRRAFRMPELHSYRDMQDMLSLDPIHDVEAAGWPVPKIDDDPAVTPKTA